MTDSLLDAAGRRRSPATMPGFHAGRPPRNKGVRYPADPPTVEEIVAVMRTAGRRPRSATARPHRRPPARRSARPRSTCAQRIGPRPPPRLAPRSTRQGWPTPGGGPGRMGVGTASTVARGSAGAPRRSAVLRRQRSDPRTALVEHGGARGAAPNRRGRRRATAVRSAPAPPRARRRDGSRRHPADGVQRQLGHKPGNHLDLPPRHRQRRSSTRSTPAARRWSASASPYSCDHSENTRRGAAHRASGSRGDSQ